MKIQLKLSQFILITFQILNLINGYSSQITQLDCQFEGDFCKWKTNNSLPNAWVNFASSTTINRSISFNGAAFGPYLSGHHIEIYKPGNTQKIPNQELLSPTLTAKSTTDCFSFDYYIHGSGVQQIELDLILNGSSRSLWLRKLSAGDIWHNNNINIGPQIMPFSLRFIISSGSGAIALANFETSSGSCSLNSLCDFESGNCNWVSTSSNLSSQFKLIRAFDAHWTATADRFDHTTDNQDGHFMEAYRSGSSGPTELISPNDNGNPNVEHCLSFWYWFSHKSDSSILDVVIKSSKFGNSNLTVWTSNAAYQAQMWYRTQANVVLGYDRQIIIKVTEEVSNAHTIGIDDISLSQNTCPPSIDCDFNIDMCGWTKDLKEDWLWDLGVGRIEDSKVLPNDVLYAPRDRREPLSGMFMYTDFSMMDPNGVGSMIMQSEYVKNGDACITFYYLALSWSNSSATFDIYLNDSIGNGKISQIVYTYDLNKDPWLHFAPNFRKWTQQTINIRKSNLPLLSKVFRIFFRVTSKSPSTYMAIDDISYREGLCSTQSGTSTTTDTTITTPYTLSTLEPSLSPSCDFESGSLCNWENDPNYFEWRVTKPENLSRNDPNYELMPKLDHTKKSQNGHFAYLSHEIDDANSFREAILHINNSVSSGGRHICITLWYMIKTNEYGDLNITATKQGTTLTNSISQKKEQLEEWKPLELEMTNGYTLKIYGKVRNGVVAIDDIKMLNEQCQKSQSKMFQCTFEDGNKCNFTPIYNPAELHLNWRVSKGYTQFNLNNELDSFFNMTDHTLKAVGGHFFALDLNIFKKLEFSTSANYKIISEPFPPTLQTCITFSYYMTELVKEESLNIYIEQEHAINSIVTLKQLWSVKGDLGRFWYTHSISINSKNKWRIVFDVTAHLTKQGIIAIDDIFLDLGEPCPPK